MNEEQVAELIRLLKAMSSNNEPDKCGGGCPCGCPTDNQFESTAARYNERASTIAAESMQSYSLQASAQNAALIAMQARFSGLPGGTL